jgi:hypothetical protein
MCREVASPHRIQDGGANPRASSSPWPRPPSEPRHPPRRHQHLARGPRERLANGSSKIDGVLAALHIVTLEPSARTTSSLNGSALFGALRTQSQGGCDSLHPSYARERLRHGSRDARPRQIPASSSAAAIVPVTQAPFPSEAHARWPGTARRSEEVSRMASPRARRSSESRSSAASRPS